MFPVIILLFLNVRMYYQPDCTSTEEGLAQLRYLKLVLKKGAAEEMQAIYPEGFIFTNALYGLSWCDLIKPKVMTSPIFQEGVEAIDWALAEINKIEAKAIFSPDLPLPYGAFYQGWQTYLMGQKLLRQDSLRRTEKDISLFKANCMAIKTAYASQGYRYLASYPNGTWPADNILCLAALRLHDRIFQDEFSHTIVECLHHIKANLDPTTGLIPHAVSDQWKDMARGSSQSLMLHFLIDIDATFARSQFALFKEKFVNYRFGLPGIREYPNGIKGNGDIDSGPVLLGIGGAASVVGIRTMATYGEWELYEGLRNSVESFGLPITLNNQKRYLFGRLPIADAFIAWANASNCQYKTSPTKNWRYAFHFYSLLPIFALSLLAYKI